MGQEKMYSEKYGWISVMVYNKDMKIYLATDHAGYEHKEELKKYLLAQGKDVVDCGAYRYEEADDYPDTVSIAAEKVSRDRYARAIILGGSGQGEAIVANKFPHVRTVVYYGAPAEIVTLSREHNDANILSIGARFVEVEEMKQVVDMWLSAGFDQDERHVRRIRKIEKIERSLHSVITKMRLRVRK
jgi:ribose 5-phosphate isomerase B